jgi:hypothetical protein
MCLPMCQEDLPADMDLKRKTDGVYDQAFSGCLDTFAGRSSFASSFPFPPPGITYILTLRKLGSLRKEG